MRIQEVFFEQEQNGNRVEVIKTYDAAFAREAFAEMDDAALDFLAESLSLEDSYDLAEIPKRTSSEFLDFLWEEVQDNAHEDGNVCSFFIVRQVHSGDSRTLYVSPDWTSAEGFVKLRQIPSE